MTAEVLIKELRAKACPNCEHSKVIAGKWDKPDGLCCDHPDNIRVDCCGNVVRKLKPDDPTMNKDLTCPRFSVRPMRSIFQRIKDWFISMWED